MIEGKIIWHKLCDEKPKHKNTRPKSYLISIRVDAPGQETIYVTTVGLWSNKEMTEGCAYTPKHMFYWGPDIFNNVEAWAEYPEYIPV